MMSDTPCFEGVVCMLTPSGICSLASRLPRCRLQSIQIPKRRKLIGIRVNTQEWTESWVADELIVFVTSVT